jgi:hypothetical protein
LDIQNLKSQLEILERIQNPAPYIIEAIKNLRRDITSYELKLKEETLIKEAIDKIVSLKENYPSLDISYSVKSRQSIANKSDTISSSKKENINLVTHLSAANKDYTYKEPRGIIFQNQSYGAVKYWKDVLEKVCNLMQQIHPTEIDKIKQLRGPNRIYFTTQLSQLNSPEARRNPRKIKNTNIYIETHWSANMHVNLCYKVIDFFGHKKSELSFITK